MAQGLINNGVSVTKSFSPNQLELLADYTVSGSAITSYTFSGLKLNADEEIVLEFTINNGVASKLALFINGNTTDTNYYTQKLFAFGTAISANRSNDNYAVFLDGQDFTSLNIKLTNNGYFVYQSTSTRRLEVPSNIEMMNSVCSSTFTLGQITSLTLLSGATNGIGIGSRFQLYKVKGQVQQTWATT